MSAFPTPTYHLVSREEKTARRDKNSRRKWRKAQSTMSAALPPPEAPATQSQSQPPSQSPSKPGRNGKEVTVVPGLGGSQSARLEHLYPKVEREVMPPIRSLTGQTMYGSPRDGYQRRMYSARGAHPEGHVLLPEIKA